MNKTYTCISCRTASYSGAYNICDHLLTQRNLPEKTVIPEDAYVVTYILPSIGTVRYEAIFTMTKIAVAYLYFGRKHFKLAGNAFQMIQITWMVTQH